MSDQHQPSDSPSPHPKSEEVDEVSLIASREQFSVSTERVAVSIARLEKYVVTEQRTITIDVTREDVRIVYDTPTTLSTDTSASRHTAGPDSPGPDTVVLFAEQIEITRRWVPVETARLDLTTHTNTETVTDTVRTEHIDTTLEPISDSPDAP